MNLFPGRVLGKCRVQPEPVARSLTHRLCMWCNRYKETSKKSLLADWEPTQAANNGHKGTALTYRNSMDEIYALNEGFGKGEGIRVLNIHKAQSLTSEGTVILRITAKQKLYDSVSHAVVAVTRHTV
ncbi:hypothetical protein EVAR_47490_1, partial [Eumeta japonica]